MTNAGKDLATSEFFIALFTVEKNWKPPKGPSKKKLQKDVLNVEWYAAAQYVGVREHLVALRSDSVSLG